MGSTKRKFVDLCGDQEDALSAVKKPRTRREEDSLCFICDHTGYLLSCAGPCLRSFHPRPKDGKNSQCLTLRIPNEAVVENWTIPWFCNNCKARKHQCFCCGELGKSDAALGRGREVFLCDVASCGRFYHPGCVAKELKQPVAGAREAIQAGTKFFNCPLHMCKACGQGEEKEKGLNLATCRRCPAAWHQKCFRNEGSGLNIQAWKPGGRFFCRKHPILKDLGTPKRNHFQFKEKIPEASTMCKEPEKKSSPAPKNKQPLLWEKVSCSSADTARLLSQPQTSKDDYKRMVDGIVAKSRRNITETTVKAMMVTEVDDTSTLGNIEEDPIRLGAFLAPFLHGNRYTSYGRHFTKVDELEKVVEELQPYVRDGDTIVDFSCGDNSFSRLLHDTLPISGKHDCKFKSFDILVSKDTLGFEQMSWFSVGLNDCGPGDSLVIGLNPPYARMHGFISHAVEMNPRILVLIIPPLQPGSFRDYECVLDRPMPDKAFYLPGSLHALNGEPLEQGNKVPPHLYILRRTTRELGKATGELSKSSQQQSHVHSGKGVEHLNHLFDDVFGSRHRLHDARLPRYMPRAIGSASQIEENETLRSPSSPGSPIEEGELVEFQLLPPKRDSR